MGVETRKKPPLPAPTDSSFNQNSGDDNPTPTEVDFATDISRRTDRTSYSIPDDGSPVTIDTRKPTAGEKSRRGIVHSRNKSQTSLLIEYFEGGTGPNVSSRPSVRVKVTPSSAKKGRQGSKDHIQITEAGGNRKPSYTRRISLGKKGSAEEVPLADYQGASDISTLSGQRAPIDIEVINKGGSDLSGTSLSNQNEEYIPINPSEISSMPPESLLEPISPDPITPKRMGDRSLDKEIEVGTMDTLKAPSRRRSRSLSRESLTRKVIEKLEADKPRKAGGGKSRSSGNSRSRSVSKEQLDISVSSPKRRSASGKHRKTEDPPSENPSLLSASQVSDARSFRSGTSKSSLNNPKLLETVEDAIRRLILPELTALKKEAKTQKNRDKFERLDRESVDSPIDEKAGLSRSLSKHASDPAMRSGKPKLVLNRDENDPGTVLSGNSIKKKKKGRGSNEGVYDAEKSFERGMSEETVIRDSPRLRSKGARDAAGAALAGGLVGGILTSEALRHHDSHSSVASLEKRERRRKRSKSHSRSHSRSGSIANTDDIFAKNDVPPMPMQSEITTSDVTRDSILTDRTSTPSSETRHLEIRQAARGSPRGIDSPGKNSKRSTNNRTLDSYYKNDDRDDLSFHSEGSPLAQYGYTDTSAEAAAMGAAAGYWSNKSFEDAGYVQGRSLSPIQSEASAEDREHARQQDAHSFDFASRENLSAASDVANRTNRPKGFSLESGNEILDAHDLRSEASLVRDAAKTDSWAASVGAGEYRGSGGNSSGSKVDIRHLTNYTDDSMDAPYLDKVTAAQAIRGVGNNPEFVHTPMAVESAVASLHGSSILDGKSFASGDAGSRLSQYERANSPDRRRELDFGERTGSKNSLNSSPLKREVKLDDDGDVNMGDWGSPAKEKVSRQHSNASEPPIMSGDALPRNSEDFLPNVEHILASRKVSDISTNPSIIRGPMGGSLPDKDIWGATPGQHGGEDVTSSPVKDETSHDGNKAAAKHMLVAAAAAGASAAMAQKIKERSLDDDYPGYGQDVGVYRDDYVPGDDTYPTGKNLSNSPLHKDEGYVSEIPNPKAASGALTPDYRPSGALYDQERLDDILGKNGPDDFTTPGHTRNFSGNSHGMASPLYDSATGRGIDRIQSKDIVALMDHLTVRDAERNARDTEILITLVRSAAEMRNSFEDMKRFIEEQDNMVIEVGNKQHEKTQRVIGGPRPLPPSSARLARGSSTDDIIEDIPAKKRNVFRRALKGLGGRDNKDIAKIEDMLHHLLEEVAELKAGQGISPVTSRRVGTGLTSYENMRDAPQDGYEPEGQAGTGSTGNQSGYFSNTSRQSQTQGFDRRRTSANRVSTVLEGDEEEAAAEPLEQHEEDILNYENTEHMLTPTREMPRGGRASISTPPPQAAPPASQSNENTPRTNQSTKKGHHKSSSSSFFPKISRWSKTTASSVADNMRNSTNTRKERPFSGVSRSGSDLPSFDVNEQNDPYGEDRIRSHTSLPGGEDANHSIDDNETPVGNRPPSPLVPSSVSDNKYQYRAHRDSINLQHPQPRAGPTARYQNHLETQALANQFSSPVSPTSDQFGSNPVLARFAGVGAGNRHSGGTGPPLSPISDTAGHIEREAENNSAPRATSANRGPPRPPKILDDGPLVPSENGAANKNGTGSNNNDNLNFSPASGNGNQGRSFAQRAAASNDVRFAEPNGHISSPGRGDDGDNDGNFGAGKRAGNGASRSFSASTTGTVTVPTTAPPTRKPTGPRPQVNSGNWSGEKLNSPRIEGAGQGSPGGTGVMRTRYRGSPNALPEYDSGEDETF